MKIRFCLILFILPLTLFSQQINVMSYNIRYNNQGDKENSWPNRKDMVCGLLQYHDPDIFGLQEALFDQITDIQNCLPDFHWFGVGRDDGEKKGEFSPIFFHKSKFILVKDGYFWLSQTPEKPGLGWDAACNRIATWGLFQSKVTGKRFFVFNTHFDHLGKEARKNSAVLIRNKIEEMTYKNAFPVILTGDFNLTPDELPISIIKKFLADSHDIPEEIPYGPTGTFNGFKFDSTPENRIDYIFVNSNIKVLEYAVLTDSKEKRYPSDHFPVMVQLQFK